MGLPRPKELSSDVTPHPKESRTLKVNTLTASDKLISLMKSEQNKLGKFSWNCYQIRRSKLFL